MEISGPRLRLLLREAGRNTESGKLAAAADLYRQILEEAPESQEAWLGLARVTQSPVEKQAAYEHVLTLEPDNQSAQEGLEQLKKGVFEEAAVSNPPTAPEIQTNNPAPAPAADVVQSQDHAHDPGAHQELQAASEAFELYCYRHPDRETSLRCYKCNKPICIECTNKTPVGYLCPDCQREAEDAFYNAKATDNLIALLVALPISLLAGFVLRFVGGGFFFWLIIFFAGGAVGSFIGQLSKRAIGKRRGRYIPYIVAGCIIFGVLFFYWPALLTLQLGALITPGIYLFIAMPAAYYWSR